LTCLMLDIDFFKRINDTYSHRVGDMVLKEFSNVLKKNIRKGDILARYGGEEFIILLPNTPKAGSISAAQKLRRCIKDHKFKSLKGMESITVSIGIASYPHERINSSDELITCADNALLDAKNKGRNQAVIYS
ncbi:MAG: GGDEF domain-containing protein, partial [Nitrospirae bacterium]|nr:GGDEF domain-containing protein [Nitrospirota bacterium]